MYYNYKGFCSIVVMALVNANKEFMVNVGINGCISDGGVLFYSKFGELYEQKALKPPHPAAFGILASRLGVFQKPICLEPEKATLMTVVTYIIS